MSTPCAVAAFAIAWVMARPIQTFVNKQALGDREHQPCRACDKRPEKGMKEIARFLACATKWNCRDMVRVKRYAPHLRRRLATFPTQASFRKKNHGQGPSR
jgi:hypothetical protein